LIHLQRLHRPVSLTHPTRIRANIAIAGIPFTQAIYLGAAVPYGTLIPVTVLSSSSTTGIGIENDLVLCKELVNSAVDAVGGVVELEISSWSAKGGDVRRACCNAGRNVLSIKEPHPDPIGSPLHSIHATIDCIETCTVTLCIVVTVSAADVVTTPNSALCRIDLCGCTTSRHVAICTVGV